MNDFINALSSFVFDFICRVIPGAVILHLLVTKQCHGRSEPFDNVALVVIMWAIGLTLDVLTEGIGRCLLGDKKWKGFHLLKLKNSAFLLPSDWKASLTRSMAYRGFFRMMLVVTVIALGLHYGGKQLEEIPTFKHIDMPCWIFTTNPLAFGILGVAFFYCWWRSGVTMNQEMQTADECLKKSPGQSPQG